MNKKRIYIILVKIFIILLIFLFFIIVIGRKYLKRLDKFIIENNSLLMKNELNKFIININMDGEEKIYNLVYSESGEIVSASLNTSIINKIMGRFTKRFQENIESIKFSKYIKEYFNMVRTRKDIYFLVPLGIISDNPFIFNLGPNIFFYYDVINITNFNVRMDIKNYGLNNVIINIYLDVTIDQSILKPILSQNNTFKYSILLSSDIVYGKVSDFLSTSENLFNNS